MAPMNNSKKNKDENNVVCLYETYFPYHVQNHDMACGIACLRMLEDWLTGNSGSECKWRDELAKGDKSVTINEDEFEKNGICADEMCELLKDMEMLPQVSKVSTAEDWMEIPKPEPENKNAYVILMDWWKNASDSKRHRPFENPRHYIIVYDFCKYLYKGDNVPEPPKEPSKPKGEKQVDMWLARYNCTQDGAGCWWAWDSLLASRVHKIWKIERLC